MHRPSALPGRFAGVDELEDFMSRPGHALVDDMARLEGDILVLGVGGKMGPNLARLAKRAAPEKRVLGVARFSEPGLRQTLESWGVETIACDLLERDQVAALPKLANVVYMAGRKFGTSGAEHLTWAMNALAPAFVAEAFSEARIVTFSTGCVYPYVDVMSQGATEDVAPNPPSGEYANSCLGRERMFQYFSAKHGTPGRLIRLNYAIDMRYGVLHDVARKLVARKPIDLAVGHVNVIWQGDANAQVLRTLHHCTRPSAPLNISGPETVSIRALAGALGRLLGKEPVFTGAESKTGWLVNTARASDLFGLPLVPLARMVRWTADWIAAGGASYDKETHYNVRDGAY